MKKSLILMVLATFLVISCEESVPVNPRAERGNSTFAIKKYPDDVAIAWMKLQMTLTRTTPGFGPAAVRAFAYSGLTMYESIVEGIPGAHSVASTMIGENITSRKNASSIYWPASANAAMASIIRSLIPTATDAGKAKIDSLEGVFNEQFSHEAKAKMLENSADYGKQIAASIFEWAQTDGFAEAMAKNSSYIIPTGFGFWEKTPPAFAAPVNVYLNEVRTFVPNSLASTFPPAPTPYSETAGSPFYNNVNELYMISQSLTPYDSLTVHTWGDFPGNYTGALRYAQLSILLIEDADLPLPVAVVAFAKHGLALNEAAASVFNAKYFYNQIRPVTYIQNVMGISDWLPMNPTPPHPEYPAAHACVGRASSRALESIFGTNYAFTDRTHEATWGSRHYDNLKAYSDESGWARALGGVHYVESVNVGRDEGQKVGDLINQLEFPDVSKPSF